LALCGCATAAAPSGSTLPTCRAGEAAGDERVAALRQVVDAAMAEHQLRAVILRVTQGGEEVVTFARGEAMPGAPATPGHHFHNGAVAMTYMTTLMLRLAERGAVDLDAPIAPWFPDLPNADRVTLRMLARSTAGYRDYVRSDAFTDALYADPFRTMSDDELVAFGLADPPWYEPDTRWSYAHTNYVLLGQALERATGRPLDELLREEILEPLGLTDTRSWSTAEIPSPALHHYTTERGFLEDATFWSTSWQLPAGAVMTSTICDMATSARGIGRGDLIDDASFQAFVDSNVVTHSGPTDTCPAEICIPFTEQRYFALGVLVAGRWIIQTPAFTGFSGLHAYLPDEDLAIAIVASGPQGTNHARNIFVAAAPVLSPDHLPPL
jgi:CubicO group peptidase (beta-lactamase class C family)